MSRVTCHVLTDELFGDLTVLCETMTMCITDTRAVISLTMYAQIIPFGNWNLAVGK